jgi:hypothetical protein
MKKFIRLYDVLLSLTNDFISRRLFVALTSAATKLCASLIAQTGWGSAL